MSQKILGPLVKIKAYGCRRTATKEEHAEKAQELRADHLRAKQTRKRLCLES